MIAAQLTPSPDNQSLDDAIAAACQSIAPNWPLDQAIAVNPWWQMRSQPMSEVSARLAALSGIRCLMPASYYLDLWQKRISPSHLQQATAELQVSLDEQELVTFLHKEQAIVPQWHNLSELLDAHPSHHHKVAWSDEIVQQISQFCGLYFKYPDRVNSQPSTLTGMGNDSAAPQESGNPGFFTAWLRVIRKDRGIEVLMGEPGLNQQFRDLAEDPKAIFDEVFALVDGHENFSAYAHALLLDINGWASWLAYQAWQDAFDGKENDLVEQLLAVRMAWELALWRHFSTQHAAIFGDVKIQLIAQLNRHKQIESRHADRQSILWVWQRALELSFQQSLHKKLLTPAVPGVNKCHLQVAFCIDVRSEPMRRALEAQSTAIQTIGFAGFFGLPLEYASLSGNYVRPQLPGLLKPAITASQQQVSGQARKDQQALENGLHHHRASAAPPSTFGLVEALGIGKAFNLIKNSFAPADDEHTVNHIDTSLPWSLSKNGEEISLQEMVDLAAGILGAMGLTDNFAPRVLLLGHGSCSANNPQAAALDCGACGGQTGEVNVKVLVQLLNDENVREGLAKQGITIPSQTLFVAGLHNTTTDVISCFGQSDGESEDWQQWLQRATQLAQRQRAGSLGIAESDTKVLSGRFTERSRNWAEIRPEWGLADNAGFVVAPRARTRGIDLQGRCFLHDYDWRQDSDFGVLELIMTAPMVVTNWINLQYYASVTDNEKYGSGNKLLHNVVGGNIGVFEGNGGDLRIGLAKQSLHDGEQWRHQPLRLSVYIAAPRDAMDSIIAKHQAVADLLNHNWLYLFQLDDSGEEIWRYCDGQWHKVSVD